MPDSSITQGLLNAGRLVHARGRSPLVVFDLDGTLYDNTVRTWRIIQEFAYQYATEYPSLAEAVSRLAPCAMAYRIEETLASVSVRDPVLLERLQDFWRHRFFTDEYVLYDLPTPGAVAFVRLLHERGIVPCYLTGRDAPNMLVGTVTSLRRDGFPIGTVNTRILLKDDPATPDEEYKRSVVENLRASGEVIGAFDNEPGLCHLFRSEFPHGLVVHLDTRHSPEAPALEAGIEQVANFLPLLACVGEEHALAAQG